MSARWTASILWAALAASLVFWALRLGGTAMPVPPHARAVDAAQAVKGDALRLFATSAAAEPGQPAPEAAARFHLVGVMAPAGAGAAGWALIGVDGKAARAVALGQPVDGEWILQSVTQNRVELGPRGAPAAAVLELATLPAAATGVLSGTGGGTAPMAAATVATQVPRPSAGLMAQVPGMQGAVPVPGSVNVGRLPGGVGLARPVPGMAGNPDAASTTGAEPAPEGLNTPSLR